MKRTLVHIWSTFEKEMRDYYIVEHGIHITAIEFSKIHDEYIKLGHHSAEILQIEEEIRYGLIKDRIGTLDPLFVAKIKDGCYIGARFFNNGKNEGWHYYHTFHNWNEIVWYEEKDE